MQGFDSLKNQYFIIYRGEFNGRL